VSGVSPFVERKASFVVALELANERGKVIGRQNLSLSYGWTVRGLGRDRYDQDDKNDGILSITPSVNIIGWGKFSSVKADDITDSLKISVPSIDGEKAQTASLNKRINIVTYDEYRKQGKYAVGIPGPAGGVVFYDKGAYTDGWRYLEAAPRDSGENTGQLGILGALQAGWGSGEVRGTQTSIGSGKRNTQLIVDVLKKDGQTGKAAQLCAALNTGGYQDWFLPSKDELDLMYKNLRRTGFSRFTNAPYWSSSVESYSYVWCQGFSDRTYDSGHGNRYGNGNQTTTSSGGSFCVRAVRSF
jgi:hypothetical protein